LVGSLPEMRTRGWAQRVFLLLASAACLSPAFAKKNAPAAFPIKILGAKSVYLDCDCRKEMAVSVPNALPELLDWGRYRLTPNRNQADLILLFSMNTYLGDYLTRDGPDKRPAVVDFTILTVIDAHTGEALWTGYKRWGYMLVARASRDLIHDFRLAVEEQVKKWTLNDVLSCASSPAYAAFAHLTSEQALAETEFKVVRKANTSNLSMDSPNAPDFCKRAELVVGPDNRILGFEVLPTAAQTLELADIIEQADRFDFSGGKDPDTGETNFFALSKDKKLLIEYQLQGRVPILVRVRYLY
jgi:hypothetical protein